MDKLRCLLRTHPKLSLAGLALAFALISALFGSYTTSPVYSGLKFSDMSTDSYFYILCGKMILRGQLPYIDFFDHKGPLSYYFDALGLSIAGGSTLGIFFLQIILLWIDFYFLFLTAKELGYSWRGFVIIGFVFAAGYAFIVNGNNTGELLMPASAVSLYFYCRAIGRGDSRMFLPSMLFAGLEAGLAFISRPTDAVYGLAMAVAYFVYWLRHGRGLALLWNGLVCFAGFLFVVGIVDLYALYKGFLVPMLTAEFIQSSKYIIHHWDFNRYITMAIVIVFTVFVFLCWFFKARKATGNKEAILFSFIFVMVCFPINVFVARFSQYWLGGWPMFSLCLLLFGRVILGEEVGKPGVFARAAVFSLAVFFAGYFGLVSYYYGASDGYALSQQVESDIVDTIPLSDRLAGDVLGLNVNPVVYLDGDIPISTKYFTNQSWWSEDNDEVASATMAYISESKPKWIISQGALLDENYDDYIRANYALAKENGSIWIYVID